MRGGQDIGLSRGRVMDKGDGAWIDKKKLQRGQGQNGACNKENAVFGAVFGPGQ